MLVALDLRDDVVDDLLDLLLGHRLRHELLEDLELVLLVLGLLLATRRAKCLGRLAAALALALEHLQLLVVGERTLKLLLRTLERVQHEAQRIAPILVAREACLLELALDAGDEAHQAVSSSSARASLPVSNRPPRTCQWRWKTVCPPPSPTLTSTL